MSSLCTATLWNAVSCIEVLTTALEFLDPASAIILTHVSSQFYIGIPRNSGVGVQIWRRYLTDERYQASRLIFQAGRDLAENALVSRANYKLILAVLVQKNSFMKISRLKSLCGSGKLSHPILPHKGQWRCLTRLDQFALKRATSENVKPHNSLGLSHGCISTEGKFIARICGRKGKNGMVRDHLVKLLSRNVSELTWVINTIVREGSNFLGLKEVLDIAGDVLGTDQVNKLVLPPVDSYRTHLGDSILHLLVKDESLDFRDKVSVLETLRRLPCIGKLVNVVNLSHETALVLLMSRSHAEQEALCVILLEMGADVNICDSKGNFFFRN